MLDVKSTDKGMLVPRMDSTARNAIVNPADGLLVYDSTTISFWYFDEKWNEIGQRQVTNGLLLGEDCSPKAPVLTDGFLNLPTFKFFRCESAANRRFKHFGTEDYLYSIEIYIGGELIGGDIFCSNPRPLESGTLSIIEGNDPNGTVIHTQTISLLEINTWHEIVIDTFLPITPNSDYTIQLEEPNGEFSWGLDDDDGEYIFRAYAFNCGEPFIIEPTTDRQTVSLTNIDTIRFSNGAEFDGVVSTLQDDDGDTRIDVERSPDQDIIQFSQEGVGAFLSLNKGHLSYGLGNQNIYLGVRAGQEDPDGQNTVANIAIGEDALRRNQTGFNNIAIGVDAIGGRIDPNTKEYDDNVAIGNGNLAALIRGSYNVSIGRQRVVNFSDQFANLYNSVLLGAEIDALDRAKTYRNVVAIGSFLEVAQDSAVILGNAADVGIGTNTPDEKLHVIGKIKMEDGNAQAGYVLTSDADGVGTWQANVTDTDDQMLSFDGTNLSIADGNSVDISTIDTDTDTDNQTIDKLNLNGTTLELSLEGDGEVDQTVDLSSIDTDTDDQTIDKLNLNGTTLELSLEDDGEVDQTVDLASIDTDTDDQTIDKLNLNGTTLELSLEDDGESDQTVDLSSIDTDTDDQTIDKLNLNGTTLELSLEDDGEVDQTVDLASIDTDTDNQTLSFNTIDNELSITNGNVVNLPLDLITDSLSVQIFENEMIDISSFNGGGATISNSKWQSFKPTISASLIKFEAEMNPGNNRVDGFIRVYEGVGLNG